MKLLRRFVTPEVHERSSLTPPRRGGLLILISECGALRALSFSKKNDTADGPLFACLPAAPAAVRDHAPGPGRPRRSGRWGSSLRRTLARRRRLGHRHCDALWLSVFALRPAATSPWRVWCLGWPALPHAWPHAAVVAGQGTARPPVTPEGANTADALPPEKAYSRAGRRRSAQWPIACALASCSVSAACVIRHRSGTFSALNSQDFAAAINCRCGTWNDAAPGPRCLRRPA